MLKTIVEFAVYKSRFYLSGHLQYVVQHQSADAGSNVVYYPEHAVRATKGKTGAGVSSALRLLHRILIWTIIG